MFNLVYKKDRPRLESIRQNLVAEGFSETQIIKIEKIGSEVVRGSNPPTDLNQLKIKLTQLSCFDLLKHPTVIDYLWFFVDSIRSWKSCWQNRLTFGAGRDEKINFIHDEIKEFSPHAGDLVLDIGSGKPATSSQLKTPGRKIINIDSAADENRIINQETLLLKLDIEVISQHTNTELKQALNLCNKFINPENHPIPRQQIDTVIMSEILNYIDYQSVITHLLPYLQSCCWLVIYNDPAIHQKPEYLSPARPRDNQELIKFLQTLNFQLDPTRSHGNVIFARRKPTS